MKADRPSATAHLIARALVFLARDPRIAPLIPPETEEASRWFMHASSRWTPALLRLVGAGWFRRLVWRAEQWAVPGIMLHYALRKQCLEEMAREALRDGYRQVVVLGAGFDTLALRLCREYPDSLFLEIDHPATQRVKRQALVERDRMMANLVLLPVDMARERLETAIRQAPQFRPDAETLFIAEGLLMYLEAAAVDEVFHFCREHGGARPRFAFTFMERLEDGRIAFRGQHRRVDTWLRLRGEPFRWGLPVGELSGYLRERGFACLGLATERVLRDRYLTTAALRRLPLADGDHVCLAEAVQQRDRQK